MPTLDAANSLAGKVSNLNSCLIKISFHLKYQTHFGQTIFLYGDHPFLGNNQLENALPLTYLNDSNWGLEIDGKNLTDQDKIIYHYYILNPDGSKIMDTGNDNYFYPKKVKTEKLVLLDAWNFSGFTENVFYTEPFAKVLLSPSAVQKVANGIEKQTTHIFRVKAPLMETNHTICLLGESDILGNWDASKPCLLNKIANSPYFEISLNLSKVVFPLVYKYGIFDKDKNKLIEFEVGNNRLIHEAANKNKLVIVNDGFANFNNLNWKGTGIAIPVFSLRSNHSMGVGEFADLKLLVDWAKQIGLKLIQLLPLNDTTAKHSWQDSYPYAGISAFALHPLYLNVESLLKKGQLKMLSPHKKEIERLNSLKEIDYERVMKLKWELLHLIYEQNGKLDLASIEFNLYFEKNAHWLVSYSAFSYLREVHGTIDFNTWPSFSRYDQQEIDALTNPTSATYHEIAFYYFIQFHLHLQLSASTHYAHENGVVVKGDIPIGVYRYGADAWQYPSLFHMDMQAGAPPDDFAVRGQNWGFPTYHWEKMKADGYKWWKLRFEQMSFYFDAFRIDHILGFFRIWSIPIQEVDGIMGRFVPAIPITIKEMNERGINFDLDRFTKPYINESILFETFGYENEFVKQNFVQSIGNGQYELLKAFQNQRAVENYFDTLPQKESNKKIKLGLFSIISNVILFQGENSQEFHFRFNVESTSSFQQLDSKSRAALKELYINYFFERQDKDWKKEAMNKLPMLKQSTNMLICGEDLGLVPSCVPDVMRELGMLSLEVQRMPKAANTLFFHPKDAPYLSVVTPSSHDTSTLRGWWEEDKNKTQYFFNHLLSQVGEAPEFCEPWINKAILLQHLYAPAMWAIFQLQDFLGIDATLRRTNPQEERINIPANPNHYWNYRMHLSLEQLLSEHAFNEQWHDAIKASGR